MTLEIPKDKWTDFFNDFSKRRFGWETKIEILKADLGDQILSEGLPLNGITFEDKVIKLEILVGESAEQHQTHSIVKPSKIAYLSEGGRHEGTLEIEEENGTKTLIHIINPMPIYVGYSNYKMVTL